VATATVEIYVDPAASTIAAVAIAIPKASATGGIVPTDTVAGGESLDPGEESIKAMGPGTGKVAKTHLSILIDAGGEAMEAKVWREISIFEVITKGVHVRLEGGDGISEFRILNSSQEDAASGTIVVMEIEFGLQSEVEEVLLGEVEYVVGVGPSGDRDRDCRIKTGNSEFQHTPEVVISIVGFIADRCQGRADLRG